MRNSLLKVVPWIGLTAIALLVLAVVWARRPAPAGEESPATTNATQQPAQPIAAEPSAALSQTPQRARAVNTSYGPNHDEPAAPLTAEQLTERAKTQLALDPAAALQDIEQADKLAGPQNETRRVIEIHALVRLGKVGKARSLTDSFYRNFPSSDRAAELERLTGYHPRPTHP
jgi:hypothetical protein